jgi:hypothetical protein
VRVLLRVLAPLLGLALAALGVLTVVEVVAGWIGPVPGNGLTVPWQAWRTTLEDTTWQQSPVPYVAIGVAVLGLLLLLVAFVSRRHEVPLSPPAPGVTVTTTPHTLARMVGQRVRAADPVASAAVTASKRSVSVRAEGWSTEEGGTLADVVRSEVAGLLDELPLARRPRVSVAVRDLDRPR